MVTIPDEMLMAYADGELNEAERQAMEKLLSQDALLRARLEPFVETRLRLSYAFEHVLHQPLPDRLVAAIAVAAAKPRASAEPAAPAWPARVLAALREALEQTFPNGVSPLMAASAALLLAIVATGGWIGGRLYAPAGMIEVADDGLVASGSLAAALESLPSGTKTVADAQGSKVKPVLSFRSQANSICREYRIENNQTLPDYAGLACRGDDGVWRLALHVETAKAAQKADPYRTATSDNVPSVDALTETLIAGASFDQIDEASLLANGWQPAPPPAPPGALR